MTELNTLLNEAAQMFGDPSTAEPATIEPPVIGTNPDEIQKRIDHLSEQVNQRFDRDVQAVANWFHARFKNHKIQIGYGTMGTNYGFTIEHRITGKRTEDEQLIATDQHVHDSNWELVISRQGGNSRAEVMLEPLIKLRAVWEKLDQTVRMTPHGETTPLHQIDQFN